jgi:hypothetical protein
MEMATVEWLVGGGVAGGFSVWGVTWGGYRYIASRIDAVRSEAAQALHDEKQARDAMIAALMSARDTALVDRFASLGREIARIRQEGDMLRAECAKREDIARLELGLSTITGRIDQVLGMMAQQRVVQ